MRSEERPTEQSGAPAARAVSAAPSAQATPTATASPSLDDFTEEPALKDVFFDPGRVVVVEEHTDYKSNREGNIAMSERRAKAAVSVLLKEGVPDTRLYIVSLGSDHPVCAEKTDACAANRRVHFRVKKQ